MSRAWSFKWRFNAYGTSTPIARAQSVQKTLTASFKINYGYFKCMQEKRMVVLNCDLETDSSLLHVVVVLD